MDPMNTTMGLNSFAGQVMIGGTSSTVLGENLSWRTVAVNMKNLVSEAKIQMNIVAKNQVSVVGTATNSDENPSFVQVDLVQNPMLAEGQGMGFVGSHLLGEIEEVLTFVEKAARLLRHCHSTGVDEEDVAPSPQEDLHHLVLMQEEARLGPLCRTLDEAPAAYRIRAAGAEVNRQRCSEARNQTTMDRLDQTTQIFADHRLLEGGSGVEPVGVAL